ncbi:class I SAM-dependent methyltransferase [uncultured Granulicatella sp.]|jgi:ribosomal protein L11 methyltransferase (prmA)|uniref:class I SAM-dependent methyltransferase n=1 Tax=uncultured Granulicatella sp. TaxID=316089 RepID=UPI0028DBDB0E|nr:class I SAM-dependent methyltransferase [uncultured Granulicatella sp.]
MANHYYTKNPESISQQKHWTYRLKGNTLSFTSDNGVFSKNTVDFGSELLVESYDIPEQFQKASLLDIGCGYGTMGLAYGKAYPELSIEMIDVNERALVLAQENAKKNGIHNVDIHESNLYDSVKKSQYEIIISNPPIRAGKIVVHTILEKAYDYLAENGQLVIVIQKKQGAPSAQKKMEEVFGNCERIQWDKGYWILVSTKD